MSDLEPARLLLAILRQDWDGAAALARRAPVEADGFVDLCLQADVPGWVHARLERAGRLDLVGAEAASRLRGIRERVRRDNLLLVARAEQALGALLAAGVTPVALKGLDLLSRLHASLDERTLDDVDLLVTEPQLPAAIEALERQGWELPPEPARTHYVRTSHHLPLTSPGPVVVGFEIHWNLAQELRYRIDQRGLFERALPLEVEGHRVLRLDEHDAVAHFLLHHFTHYFDRRLKWAIDIENLARAPGFDWSRVVERIREWEATVVAGMSLVHLHKLFPAWIPADAVAALRVARWRRLLCAPLRSGHPLDLFRATRRRWVQLYLATVLMEHPGAVPGWLLHRATRERRAGTHPLDHS
jgi:hypothetical protein